MTVRVICTRCGWAGLLDAMAAADWSGGHPEYQVECRTGCGTLRFSLPPRGVSNRVHARDASGRRPMTIRTYPVASD